MVSASEVTMCRGMWCGRIVATGDIGCVLVMRKDGEVSGCDLVPFPVHWSGEETPCYLSRALLTPQSLDSIIPSE